MPNRCQRIKVEPLDSAVCHCSAQSPPPPPGVMSLLTTYILLTRPTLSPRPPATNNMSCFQRGFPPEREDGQHRWFGKHARIPALSQSAPCHPPLQEFCMPEEDVKGFFF